MRQFFSFAFLSAISYLCHRVFDKSKWNTKDTAFKVDKSLPRLLPYAVCQIVRFDWNFWWQKVAPKPSACRFRGNHLRPALSGRSKIRPLQPPAPGTRAVGCPSSATSENAAVYNSLLGVMPGFCANMRTGANTLCSRVRPSRFLQGEDRRSGVPMAQVRKFFVLLPLVRREYEDEC